MILLLSGYIRQPEYISRNKVWGGFKRPAFFVAGREIDMKASVLEKKLDCIVRPVIEDMGFRLVWISANDTNVQITAEDMETRRLGVDDCAKISRAVSTALDVEDPINGNYNLEVSSPGIDRMLYTGEDYQDFAGFEAKVELDEAIEGQRRYRGIIKGFEDDKIILKSEEEEFRLSIESVKKAKLVMNDELIAATSGKQSVS